MAGANGFRPRARAIALAAVVAMLGLIAGAQPAGGGVGGACNAMTNAATFTFDDDGLRARVSASYNENFMGGDKVAASYRGEDDGVPRSGAASCTDPDPFANVFIVLGNLDDKARLDARKPSSLDSQATDPIPAFVTVSIDGNRGADELRGHSGTDGMSGGAGPDLIRVAGGGSDEINCGRGQDKAVVDVNDLVANCEEVVTP